jgi:hypothetical protein
LSGLRLYKAQPTPEPVPGDYGLVEMPGAPAHIEAMLLGWRFSHAVLYVGQGQLVEAWFDCVPKRNVAEYPARDISWFGVRSAPDGSCVTQGRRDQITGYALSRLGQLYDYPAWPAVYIRYIARVDRSGLYTFDSLATCSALVAKAYGLVVGQRSLRGFTSFGSGVAGPRCDDRSRRAVEKGGGIAGAADGGGRGGGFNEAANGFHLGAHRPGGE